MTDTLADDGSGDAEVVRDSDDTGTAEVELADEEARRRARPGGVSKTDLYRRSRPSASGLDPEAVHDGENPFVG